jgi:hypothetical protein
LTFDPVQAMMTDNGRAVPAFTRKEPVMLPENAKPFCPECNEPPDACYFNVDRRDFLRSFTGTAAALALGGIAASAPRSLRADEAARTGKPAEALVKELFTTLSEDQKKTLVLPWNHGAAPGKIATRLGMYNGPIAGKKIGDHYTKPQQELIERILRSISSGDDGYRQFTRNGTFDASQSLQGCGATFFGEAVDGKQYAFVFAGHHLTVRCDGDSEEGAAFGGPIYYGHSPHGYSTKNCFQYQTKSVMSVWDALSEKQREKAEIGGAVGAKGPGEQAASVRFRKPGEPHPGITYAELSPDQRQLVENVMRVVLSPYRKEDVDEVMQIIKTNGGMEKIHLAFYKDDQMNDQERWHFWRLEGPGFVWNYRILPHVHTFVNISSKLG